MTNDTEWLRWQHTWHHRHAARRAGRAEPDGHPVGRNRDRAAAERAHAARDRRAPAGPHGGSESNVRAPRAGGGGAPGAHAALHRLVLALQLLFLVPWLVDGYRIHVELFTRMAVLTVWVPGALICAVALWTVSKQRILREQRQRLRTALGADSRFEITLLLVLCLGGAAACAKTHPASAHGENPVVAFVNVSVVPMTEQGNILPGRTVIVRDGRIAVIGDARTTALPAGAVRVEGEGRFLMPTLADMHVHLEYDRDPELLRLFIENGVTTVRSMDGRPYIRDWRDAIRRGEMIGPRIVTAGPILDGDPPVRDDNIRVGTPEQARREVRAQVAAGYDFVKVYSGVDTAVWRAIVDEARASGIAIAGHAPRAVGVRRALGEFASLEHLSDFAGIVEADTSAVRGGFHWSRMFVAVSVDSVKVDALAREVARSGTAVVPTLVERERALAPRDSVNRWLRHPGMSRITAADALAAATREAARFLGELDNWGTVEPGKRADLLLLTGNPLDDIAHTRAIEGVMVDGRWFPPTASTRAARRRNRT